MAKWETAKRKEPLVSGRCPTWQTASVPEHFHILGVEKYPHDCQAAFLVLWLFLVLTVKLTYFGFAAR